MEARAEPRDLGSILLRYERWVQLLRRGCFKKLVKGNAVHERMMVVE